MSFRVDRDITANSIVANTSEAIPAYQTLPNSQREGAVGYSSGVINYRNRETWIPIAVGSGSTTPAINLVQNVGSFPGAEDIFDDYTTIGGDKYANLKKIAAGANIVITDTLDTLVISGVAGPGSILVDGGTTPGHQSLVQNGIGPALATKGLVGLNSVSLSSTSDDVTIDVPFTLLTSTGPGNSLVTFGIGPVLGIRNLVQGTGITLTQNLDNITFDVPSGAITTLSDAGVGNTLITDGTGPSLSIKKLIQGSGGITLTPSADGLTFDVPIPAVTTLTDTGLGASLITDGTGPVLGIRKLIAGENVTLTQNTNDVTIAAADQLITVRVATTTDLALEPWDDAYTYNSPDNISIVYNAPPTVDGVVLQVGDRILVKDQFAVENGIYQVTSIGATLELFRTSDVLKSSYVIGVNTGTYNAQAQFSLATLNPVVIGVSSLNFVRQTGVITSTGVSFGSFLKYPPQGVHLGYGMNDDATGNQNVMVGQFLNNLGSNSLNTFIGQSMYNNTTGFNGNNNFIAGTNITIDGDDNDIIVLVDNAIFTGTNANVHILGRGMTVNGCSEAYIYGTHLSTFNGCSAFCSMGRTTGLTLTGNSNTILLGLDNNPSSGGVNQTLVGRSNQTSVSNTILLGDGNVSVAADTVACGLQNITSSPSCVMFGRLNGISGGTTTGCSSIGNQNTISATSTNVHTIGTLVSIQASNSNVFAAGNTHTLGTGCNTSVFIGNGITVGNGNSSSVIVGSTITTGAAATNQLIYGNNITLAGALTNVIAFGNSAQALSADVTVFGNGARAIGTQSMIFGTNAFRVSAAGAIQNTAFGYNAGFNATTCTQNTAIGCNTLYYNLTGVNNTAVGANCLGTNAISTQAPSSYTNCTGVGQNCMLLHSLGNFCTAVGVSALRGTNPATFAGPCNNDSDTAIGAEAMNNVQISVRNCTLGRDSLKFAGTASDNCVVGYQSMFCNTALVTTNNVTQNCAFGTSTLQSTSGVAASMTQNCAYGYQSMSGPAPTVARNSAYGYQTLQTTLANNGCAFGYLALNGNSSGANNCGFGTSAGISITTGSNNLCLGPNSNAAAASSNRISIGNTISSLVDSTCVIGSNSLIYQYSSVGGVGTGGAGVTQSGFYALAPPVIKATVGNITLTPDEFGPQNLVIATTVTLAGENWTTPTAAAIIAKMPGIAVGGSYFITFRNEDAAGTITLLADATVTFGSGLYTILPQTVVDFKVTTTSATAVRVQRIRSSTL